MPTLAEVAELVRALPEPVENLRERVDCLVRRATAGCTPTIAVAEAAEDFLAEFRALLEEAEQRGNVSRKTAVLGKLETLRLLCGRSEGAATARAR